MRAAALIRCIPQAAQLAAALAAIAIRVPKAAHHRLIGAFEILAARSPLPFGELEDFLVSATSNEASFCSCHEHSPYMKYPAKRCAGLRIEIAAKCLGGRIRLVSA